MQGGDHPALFSRGLTAGEVHWVSGEAPGQRVECTAKFRYRQPDQQVTVKLTDGGAEVLFAERQRAITPGQAVVFYDGEVCLGGGTIESAW